MTGSQTQNILVSGDFNVSANPKHKKRRTPPFSLRLTDEERDYLECKAGQKPLGAYIRERLLGEAVQPRQTVKKPRHDDVVIAQLLAELGRSHIPSNLNQLAKAVNTGALGLSYEVEQDLMEACRAIVSMRDRLLVALGVKPEGNSQEHGA